MMREWTTSQKWMFWILVLACIHYIVLVARDRLFRTPTPLLTEGFADTDPSKQSQQDNSLYTWISDPQLIYDEFYAGVYDQLSQQAERTAAKVAVCNSIWKKDTTPIQEWSVLDVGTGTGHAVVAWAKEGAGRVVGMDCSPAMLRQAEQKVLPASKCTESQLECIRWRQDNCINPSACAPAEFSHITCFYFTIYYMQDKEQFFRHLNLWTKPGGKLCVEVVNKYKFDPVLESASPFLAFSPQKYSKDRLLKSKVAFDKFDYEAEFQLTDPKAEFYETFRFKNGHVRRQKHVFVMPKIEEVVAMATRAGWTYVGFQDLNPLGFEYAYCCMFTKK